MEKVVLESNGNEKNKENSSFKSPKEICAKARKINRWFHFTRNNPRNRYYLYNEFKNWVGADKWGEVLPEIKNSWEAASNSFDKLYGLIKVYSGYKTPAEVTRKRINPTVEDEIKKTSDNLHCFIEVITKLKKDVADANLENEDYELLQKVADATIEENSRFKSEIKEYINKILKPCHDKEEK